MSGPTGPLATIYLYNAGINTVSLGLGALTIPGTYTVTVSDLITAGGIRLDGEISNPASPASLPSGDGLPNGNAVYTFTVTGCAADFNQDGIADFFDYLDFVDAFSANNSSADFNGDSVIDFFDYLDFVDSFSAGC